MLFSGQTHFYIAGGTLRPDAPSYVERQADADLYYALRQGEFCYILTSRQMGKSSLMVRTTARLREEGVAVAVLDLTRIGQNLTPEQWYEGLLDQLGWYLGLEDELEEFWEEQEGLGPLQRWMTALRDVVLRERRGRVVIFIDEIDAVRSLPFSSDEFFAAIRECYTRRAEDPDYNRLTFCLLGVAAPTDLIRDTRTTPFNIGRRVDLTDFTEEEAAPLGKGFEGAQRNGRTLLQRVLYWTRGHPYLTQRLCRSVAEDASVTGPSGVDRHCEVLFLSSAARERDDNLLFVRERLLKSEAELVGLLDLYDRVRSGKQVPVDDTNQLVSILRLSGITRLSGARLQVRNRIYERVFDRTWITQHMPDAELRRQQAAYRRGVLRTAAVAGVVVAALAGLTITALMLARRERQAHQIAARNLYAAQINLASQAVDVGNVGRALALLELQRPGPGEEDLRAFEWRYLWRRCQGDQRFTLRGHTKGVQGVAISPDGKTLASASADTTVRLWDAASMQELATLRGHKAGVNTVAFSPDGRRLASGSDDGSVNLWDLGAWREAGSPKGWDWSPYTLRGHKGGVRGVVFSPGGRTVASLDDSAVRLWDVASRQQVAQYPAPQLWGSCLAFSPDGKTIASDAGFSAKLWNVTSKREIATLPHKGLVFGATFSPDGRSLATAGADSTVKLWDVASRREITTFKGHRGTANSVAFSPDGKRVASASSDGTVKIWDLGANQEVATLIGHAAGVWRVVFSPDGKTLVSASSDTTVRLWDASPKRDTAILPNKSWVDCVACSPDGKLVASGTRHEAMLWDAVRGRDVATLPHPRQVGAVAFSPDGKILATGCGDGCVRLWDVASRRKVAILKGHRGPVVYVPGVAFSPDGRILASVSYDQTLKLWDVASRRELASLPGYAFPAYRMAFSPDGRILASGGDRKVNLWDVSSRREVATLPAGGGGSSGLVHSVAFSPDGRILASGTIGGLVKLWDVATKRELTHFSQGPGEMMAVVFSPDGKRLATTKEDGTIRIWNPAIRQEVATLTGHTISVRALAFSPDGNTLASASGDTTVRLWRAAIFAEADARRGALPSEPPR